MAHNHNIILEANDGEVIVVIQIVPDGQQDVQAANVERIRKPRSIFYLPHLENAPTPLLRRRVHFENGSGDGALP